jgi:cyclin T
VAAILLAAKTEESPKKLVVVIEESYKVKLRGMQAGRISQAATTASSQSPSSSSAALSPQTMTNISEKFDPKSEQFVKLKERILLLERVILHTIGFELSVDHPYKFLVDMCKKLTQTRQVEFIRSSDNAPAGGNPTQVYAGMLNSLVQYSMNFANDSMQTSLCLQFVPQKIAAACVYLACHCCRVKPVDPKASWLDLLGNPDVECLASIVVQITELVTDRKGADAALFDKIRSDLDKLKASTATAAAATTDGDSRAAVLSAPDAKPAAVPPPPPPPPPPSASPPGHETKRQRTH